MLFVNEVFISAILLAPAQHHQRQHQHPVPPSYNRQGVQPQHHPVPNPQFQHNKQGMHQPQHNPLVPFDKEHWDRSKDYHLKHGHKFKYGYYYPGYKHYHWDRCHWDKNYGCWLYHDPCCLKWYYWCAPHYCYYPVEYCPIKTYTFGYEPNPTPPQDFVQPSVPYDDNGDG